MFVMEERMRPRDWYAANMSVAALEDSVSSRFHMRGFGLTVCRCLLSPSEPPPTQRPRSSSTLYIAGQNER
jgi:hypothetical protein